MGRGNISKFDGQELLSNHETLKQRSENLETIQKDRQKSKTQYVSITVAQRTRLKTHVTYTGKKMELQYMSWNPSVSHWSDY